MSLCLPMFLFTGMSFGIESDSASRCCRYVASSGGGALGRMGGSSFGFGGRLGCFLCFSCCSWAIKARIDSLSCFVRAKEQYASDSLRRRR